MRYFVSFGRNKCSITTLMRADIIDPARIPSLASASSNACCRGSYASPAMKRATVKPMPLSMHTLANAFHELPLGRRTSFVRMASQEKENTPRNFPSTRPSITASPTPENRLSKPMPWKDIPALAKAKTGIIIKLTGV